MFTINWTLPFLPLIAWYPLHVLPSCPNWIMWPLPQSSRGGGTVPGTTAPGPPLYSRLLLPVRAVTGICILWRWRDKWSSRVSFHLNIDACAVTCFTTQRCRALRFKSHFAEGKPYWTFPGTNYCCILCNFFQHFIIRNNKKSTFVQTIKSCPLTRLPP